MYFIGGEKMSIQRIGQIVGNFKAGEEILSSIRIKTNNSSLEIGRAHV